MNNFSIKDIEMLSGIKAHTFRIWEQRHGLSLCKRKESQHRYYDNEDLKAILRIALLYHHGYKISKIAILPKEEIIKLAAGDFKGCNNDSYVYQLIEATMDYDELLFKKIIDKSIVQFGFEKSVSRVIYPFMQRVGLLWITEHLIPAQEHFSSSLIQHKILMEIDKLNGGIVNKEAAVLIFSPEGEHHEMPLMIAHYLFKKSGIRTIYFGSDVPSEQIDIYCSKKIVTHFFIHLITNFANKDAGNFINCLAQKFPYIRIIASGRALHHITGLPATVKIIHSPEDLVSSLG